MKKTHLKATLLGACAGFLITEYLVLRRGAQAARQAKAERAANLDAIAWAQYMVEQEALRGKYNFTNLDQVYNDFDYYRSIARLRHET